MANASAAQPSPAGDMPVRDEALSLDGLRLHYRDWGDPTAPPLLLLHGSYLHARIWDTFARAMASRFRVLAPDLRGHGESDHSPDCAVERVLTDLEELVGQLGLGEFSLVGYSVGGRLGCAYAAQHPDRVGRLVMIESFSGTVRVFPPAARAVLDRLFGLPDDFADLDETVAAYHPLAPRAAEAEVRHWVSHGLRQRPDGRWVWRIDPILRRPGPPGRLNPTPDFLGELLPRVTCPALLVCGADSFQVEWVEPMAAAMRQARVAYVPSAGHLALMENPTGFLEVVGAFLTQP